MRHPKKRTRDVQHSPYDAEMRLNHPIETPQGAGSQHPTGTQAELFPLLTCPPCPVFRKEHSRCRSQAVRQHRSRRPRQYRLFRRCCPEDTKNACPCQKKTNLLLSHARMTTAGEYRALLEPSTPRRTPRIIQSVLHSKGLQGSRVAPYSLLLGNVGYRAYFPAGMALARCQTSTRFWIRGSMPWVVVMISLSPSSRNGRFWVEPTYAGVHAIVG